MSNYYEYDMAEANGEFYDMKYTIAIPKDKLQQAIDIAVKCVAECRAIDEEQNALEPVTVERNGTRGVEERQRIIDMNNKTKENYGINAVKKLDALKEEVEQIISKQVVMTTEFNTPRFNAFLDLIKADMISNEIQLYTMMRTMIENPNARKLASDYARKHNFNGFKYSMRLEEATLFVNIIFANCVKACEMPNSYYGMWAETENILVDTARDNFVLLELSKPLPTYENA